MKEIGIFYGSTTGNTKNAAIQLAKELDSHITQVYDVSKIDISEIEPYQNIILGCSTEGMGDLQANFESFLPKLKKADLKRKKVAILGTGNQTLYPDSFADAIGTIYKALENSGCEIVGKISTNGYSFHSSKAKVENLFVGLPLDENNQDLNQERIKNWAKQLLMEFRL